MRVIGKIFRAQNARKPLFCVPPHGKSCAPLQPPRLSSDRDRPLAAGPSGDRRIYQGSGSAPGVAPGAGEKLWGCGQARGAYLECCRFRL